MGQMGHETQYTDGWWESSDGLRLHYRDYAGPKNRLPILCFPGLTRNARDFEPVAERFAGEWRMICVDLRGRGESMAAADAAQYNPLTYLGDLEALLVALKIKRFVAFGTSLGGILTMLLAAAKPGRVAGALLNDIGPVLEPGGLNRIRGFVGRAQVWPTWIHAARGIAEMQGSAYPDYGLMDWLAMAKRTCRLTSQGRITLDYDMRIAEPIRADVDAPAADLWPQYAALGDAPVTILRGELSDLLSADTAKAMVKKLPNAKLVTIPRVGHTPALDEPASVKAMTALLKVLAT
jgi:pimeloyl-ACP methyl ester carboxylesterase